MVKGIQKLKSGLYRGSTWNKWDLHVHTPASIVQHYGDPEQDSTWEKFISDLESLPKEFAALGINDYWFLDGYKRLLKEKKENSRLSRFELFPVVEFRIAKFAGVEFNKLKRPNLHVVFSNDLEPNIIQQQFLNNLEQSYTLDKNGGKWESAITRESLTELGHAIKKDVPKSKLKDYQSDLVEGFNNLSIDEREVFKILKKRSALKNKYFTALGKTEWDQLAWTDSSIATKKSIINDVDMIFTAAESPESCEAARIKLKRNKVNHLLLDCSDAHDFSESSQKDRIGNCFTWIKSDVTFEGLRQVLYEPDERLIVADKDPNKFQHAIIDSFSSNTEEGGDFLLEKLDELALNPHLTCVIGPRGAGKSSLLDAIAYSLGDEEVIKHDRNNYIGYFSGHTMDDWVSAKARNSSDGELVDVYPTTGYESGIEYDYYHQKYIGWLANPNQEEVLSSFLFDKIFESATDSDTLFAELQDTKENTISALRLNREEIINCLHEINKEEGIKASIEAQSNKKKFWSQGSIKKLLEQRSIIVALGERIKRIEERLGKEESEPIVGKKDVLDTDFFENLKLSSLDPNTKVLPETWTQVEKAAIELTEKSETSQDELRQEFDELTDNINKITKAWNIQDDLKKVFKKIQKKAEKNGIQVSQANLDKIDRLDKLLVTLEEKLKEIDQKKKDKKRLLRERTRLIQDYRSALSEIKKDLTGQFKSLLQTNGKILKDTVRVDISIRFDIAGFVNTVKESARHDQSNKPKKFPRSKALLNTFRESDLSCVIKCFLDRDFSDWEESDLGPGELEYFQSLDNSEEVGMLLQEILPDLTSRLRWRHSNKASFKSLRKCSIGERGTALLSVILVTGTEPLIIDQPEDDLDHFYLAKTLTPIIKEVKRNRQLIFATHDANIAINGDAELVITVSIDGGKVTPTSSSIENVEHRETLVNILEGGKQAFDLRSKRYNLKH